MANNSQIGCAGRTLLVDPNKFSGHNSLDNRPVSLEDLSISVELTTSKKSRTILTTDKSAINTVSNTSNNQKPVTINFIQGSDVGGKKVLTTNFTDLTTDFSSQNLPENFGITNIDIDFNSMYAPMITMNFVDVRGGAIFQNEKGTINGTNPYSVFFQLPYPMFSLVVKGYYGQPVRYCLHMLKMTSKFNSRTGNFEITATFVGYTFAFLSDMLLGYLKAIAYTTEGINMYKEINSNLPDDNKILTLNEFINAVNSIDKIARKIKAEDSDVSLISTYNNKLTQISQIREYILLFGQSVDTKQLTYYPFVIVNSNTTTTPKLILLTINLNTSNLFSTTLSNIDFLINSINLNTDNQTLINIPNTNSSVRTFNGLTLNYVNPQGDSNIVPTFITKAQSKGSVEPIALQTDLYSEMSNRGLNDNSSVDVYDFSSLYKDLDLATTRINQEIDTLQKNIALKLRATIKSEVNNFDTSVRGITNVFTTAAEVLLEVLRNISIKAQSDVPRAQALSSVFKVDTLNIKTDSNSQTIFYPWLEYRKETNDGLVETYLGNKGVLSKENIDKVTELKFVDEFLNAFLSAKADTTASNISLKFSSSNWLPTNPLDSKLFNQKSPYERINQSDQEQIKAYIMIRVMTMLGYSNIGLTKSEIESFATSEASQINTFITTPNIINALKGFKTSDYLSASYSIYPTINKNVKPTVVTKNGSGYIYNFIRGYSGNPTQNSSSFSNLIPINNIFSENWSSNSYSDGVNLRNNNGDLFLTNYSFNNSTKPDDGGIYVKIYSDIDYKSTNYIPLTNQIPLKIPYNDLKKLTTDSSYITTCFNISSGPYGQEFSSIDWGYSSLDGLDFRFIFYEDGNKAIDNNISNGIALTRSASNNKNKNIIFDLNKNNNSAFPLFEKLDDFYNSSKLHNQYGQNRLLSNKYNSNRSSLSYPYINFNIYHQGKTGLLNAITPTYQPISLFGSQFYYTQNNDYSKALLFLHTFPWAGLVSPTNDKNKSVGPIFNIPEILNTFSYRSGSIQVPLLWPVFIGSLLWRLDTSEPIYDAGNINNQIGGGSGQSDPILFKDINNNFVLPTITDNSQLPNRNQYLTLDVSGELVSTVGKNGTQTPMCFGSSATYITYYLNIENQILNMPEQAKIEFKKQFFAFVNNQEFWGVIKNSLEIFDNSSNKWISSFSNLISEKQNAVLNQSNFGNAYQTYLSLTINNLSSNGFNLNNNLNNYSLVQPITYNSSYSNNFLLEISDDSTNLRDTILTWFLGSSWIINNEPFVWKHINYNDNYVLKTYEKIEVSSDDLNTFFNKFIPLLTPSTETELNKNKQDEQELFGTSDENIIKLQIYNYCKNLYDKWIAGSTDSYVINQCGVGQDSPVNSMDLALSKKRGNKSNNSRLIDSFRFVSRSFEDIGDDLLVNPTPLLNYLIDNSNTSLYDCISDMLAKNYFNFIPLPAYINYQNNDILANIFKPVTNNIALANSISGPSFVCVYTGQPSKNLEFNNSDYPNDGFDIRFKDNNSLEIQQSIIPADFSNPPKTVNVNGSQVPYENNVAVFSVNYGQQNQNIFKDITLDQSEFSETDESFRITDDISKKGNEAHSTFVGQNLYSIYSVRSYKVEVEMMGNAMIQPMMYFQLNNIPMFHGLYMITKVTHNIKPNFMSTHFTGVRIRKAKTDIITNNILYMSLIDSLGVSESGSEPINSPKLLSNNSQPLPTNINISNLPPVNLPISKDDGLKDISWSKPIRDLVAIREVGTIDSKGYDKVNFNISNNTKITNMTIQDLLPILLSTKGAAGKYQIQYNTLLVSLKGIGIDPSTYPTQKYDSSLQEKLGHFLITSNRQNLKNYFLSNDGSDGISKKTNTNDPQLEHLLMMSIDDLSKEFAALPTFHNPTNGTGPIDPTVMLGYNNTTTAYFNILGNPKTSTTGTSPIKALDVAIALVKSWQLKNPDKTPKITVEILMNKNPQSA